LILGQGSLLSLNPEAAEAFPVYTELADIARV
jgi:hypothetical protein